MCQTGSILPGRRPAGRQQRADQGFEKGTEGPPRSGRGARTGRDGGPAVRS
jgi:hypothetical protein